MGHIKRISMPKSWALIRKSKSRFAIVPKGSYKIGEGLPLAIIVRDFLKLANNGIEAKKIIRDGEIKVNNKIVKNEKEIVGLFDKIYIPKIGEYFELRMKRSKIIVDKISEKDAEKKISKIIGKKILNGGIIQLNLVGGKNFQIKGKISAKVGDSALLNVRENKIEKIIPFEKNAACLIIGGKNMGEEGRIIEIKDGADKIKIKTNQDKEIEVLRRNILVLEK